MRKACIYDHTVEQIVHTRNKRLNLRRALTCLDPIQFRQLTPVRSDAVSGLGMTCCLWISLNMIPPHGVFRNRMGRILAYSGEKTGVSKGKGDFLMNT